MEDEIQVREAKFGTREGREIAQENVRKLDSIMAVLASANRCTNCRVPTIEDTCDLCFTMDSAARQQPGLRMAQAEFERENDRLISNKLRIMSGDQDGPRM